MKLSRPQGQYVRRCLGAFRAGRLPQASEYTVGLLRGVPGLLSERQRQKYERDRLNHRLHRARELDERVIKL